MENAQPPVPLFENGGGGVVASIHVQYSGVDSSPFGSTPPVAPAVKRKRRLDHRQTTFEFRPSGRGG
ncbi:MAG: hypothetical protein OXU77_10800, partial [Gammaproteobacteria bacterium]|nr:hypothetical protein [Gammaproteobacteria bacterium]